MTSKIGLKGRSYDTLVAKSSTLSFKVKMPGEDYFDEGDVSEISTLFEVNYSLTFSNHSLPIPTFNYLTSHIYTNSYQFPPLPYIFAKN